MPEIASKAKNSHVRRMVTPKTDRAIEFEDYYEVLQLSPNADTDTIDRVFRVLVRRYHPDNQATGDPEKFSRVVTAHRVLSNSEHRAAYDVTYEEKRGVLQIFDEETKPEGYEGDRRIFDGILSLLYISRRRDANRGGMGILQLERMLGCPAQHLEFHVWYLREKSWVERTENGMLAITASGVDRVIEQESLFLRRDRLLSERSSDARPELGASNTDAIPKRQRNASSS
jgi:curved DNA-binding protein